MTETESDSKNVSGRINQIVDRYFEIVRSGNSSLGQRFDQDQLARLHNVLHPNWKSTDRYAAILSDLPEAIVAAKSSATTPSDQALQDLLEALLPALTSIELLALIEQAESSLTRKSTAKE